MDLSFIKKAHISSLLEEEMLCKLKELFPEVNETIIDLNLKSHVAARKNKDGEIWFIFKDEKGLNHPLVGYNPFKNKILKVISKQSSQNNSIISF